MMHKRILPSEKFFVEITSITLIDLKSTSGRRDSVPQIDELSMSTSIRRRFDEPFLTGLGGGTIAQLARQWHVNATNTAEVGAFIEPP